MLSWGRGGDRGRGHCRSGKHRIKKVLRIVLDLISRPRQRDVELKFVYLGQIEASVHCRSVTCCAGHSQQCHSVRGIQELKELFSGIMSVSLSFFFFHLELCFVFLLLS